MVDNLSTDVQQETNVTFLEERAKMQETTFPSAQLDMPSRIEAEMAESHWSARQQLMRPMQVSQVTWTTSQAPGTEVASFTFPEIIGSIDSVIRRTLNMYTFYKMSPVFRFQLNATQFHQGQLIISFDPFRQASTDPAQLTTSSTVVPLFNRYYATGLPSIKIMASESDPVELKIPYIHPKNFLASYTGDLDSYNLMGEIRVNVLNQLKVADGTTPNLTLTTWVYAADSSVHVPIFYHDMAVEPTSAISSAISNGSNLIGNLVTGNIGKGLRSGQGLIDDLGKLFGFDYPVKPIAPDNTIKNVETLANARGATRSERLALDPVSGHNPDTEETRTLIDELDISRIIQMPMLLSQFQFNNTHAPRTLLYAAPVTPSIYTPLGTTTVNMVQPSYLSYLSKFFAFWRGSIQFDFEFVATRFHSGKLIVAFVPNDFLDAVGTVSYDALANACPTAVLDLQQTSKLSFTVPFQSSTPLKYTTARDSDSTILGYIYVFVQNQLTYASNVSPAIDANVYIRAGPDFTYMVPRAPNQEFTYLPTVEATSDITFQTSRTGQEDATAVATLTHGQPISVAKPRFGETFSIVDCMRRFTAISEVFPLTSAGSNTILPVHPLITGSIDITTDLTTLQNAVLLPSYVAQLGKLYSCWIGSLRYKFCTSSPRSTVQALSIYHIPDYHVSEFSTAAATETDLCGYAAASTDLAQNTTLEIEVPYYSHYNFLLTSPTTPSTGTDPYLNDLEYPYINGVLLVRNLNTPTGETPTCRVYSAVGEDFKFFYLRSPPQIQFGFVERVPIITTPI